MEYRPNYENELYTLPAKEDSTQVEITQNHSYDHIDWQESPRVHQSPSATSEPKKPAPQDNGHSKLSAALVSVVLLTVLILGLLLVIVVLVSIQISANKYQQEFQLLKEEVYQLKITVQNSAASKFKTKTLSLTHIL